MRRFKFDITFLKGFDFFELVSSKRNSFNALVKSKEMEPSNFVDWALSSVNIWAAGI